MKVAALFLTLLGSFVVANGKPIRNCTRHFQDGDFVDIEITLSRDDSSNQRSFEPFYRIGVINYQVGSERYGKQLDLILQNFCINELSHQTKYILTLFRKDDIRADLYI